MILAILFQLIPATLCAIAIWLFKRKDVRQLFDYIYLAIQLILSLTFYGFITPFFMFWGSNVPQLSVGLTLFGIPSWHVWYNFWSIFVMALWILVTIALIGLMKTIKDKITQKHPIHIKKHDMILGNSYTIKHNFCYFYSIYHDTLRLKTLLNKLSIRVQRHSE